jgi:translocation and assembly module TamB
VSTVLEAPSATKRPKRKRRIVLQAAIAFALLGAVIAVGLYLTSDGFKNRMRLKVVSELEVMTGGRVELENFQWNLSRLEFDLSNITIHGLEGPNDVPYVHIDRLILRAKILSLPGREIALRYVRAEHPVIHIIAYADGTTNQPRPKVKSPSGESPVQSLFDLRMSHLEVHDGLILWNDRPIPMNFAAESVSTAMTHVPAGNFFDSKVRISKLNLNYRGSPELTSELEAELSLHPRSVDLKALHLSTRKSSLDARGGVADFNHPKVELTYHAVLDLAEAGQVARIRPLRAGSMDLEGRGSFVSAKDFSSTGKVQVKNASWVDNSTGISGVNAESDFLLDPKRLSLSRLVARVLGGTVSGDFQVLNWLSPQPARAPVQQGTAHLKIADLELGQAEKALVANSRLFARVQLASTITGKIDVRWSGAVTNAEAQMALDLNAPANPPASSLPLHGTVKATYLGSTERLDVQQLNVATRGTRLDAVGTMGAVSSSSAALRVNLNTTDLSELAPVLRALRENRPLPFDLIGRASFSGTVTGKLKEPALAGHLEAHDFDIQLPLSTLSLRSAGAAAPQSQRVHWDSLTTDLSYSSSSVKVKNGLLRRGPAQIAFNGSAGLNNGNFDQSSPIATQAKITNADVGEIQALLGMNYPVSGTLDAQASFRGSLNNLHGSGQVQVRGGEIYGQPYHRLQSNLLADGQQLRVTQLQLEGNGAAVTGRADYNLQTKVFAADLRGNNFILARFLKQKSRTTIAGTAQFVVSGSGTLEQPTLNANVVIQGAKLNQQSIGDVTLSAITQGTNLHLTGRSSLANSELALDGDVTLQQSFPGQMKVTFTGLDVNPLLAMLETAAPPLHSSITGTLVLAGAFQEPRRLNAIVEIPRLSATMENLMLHNDGPVRLSVRDQVATIEQFHVVGTDTDIAASGTVNLAGTQAMRVRANGRVNLKLLESFDPDLVSYGMTDFTLRAGGTIPRPDLTGRLNIQNAGISILDAPNGLSEINGVLLFEQNRLRIDKLTARSGGGNLNLAGSIGYNNGLYFDVTARGQDIRIRYPDGVSSQGNASLRFVGTTKDAVASGDIVITRFAMSPHFDLALYLARSNLPPATPSPNSVVDNVRLDLHVISVPELRVETSLAKLAGDVDLRVKGTLANPSVLGRVNIAEGDIFFNDTKYHLERGDVTFTNPVQIEPVLNVDASTRIKNYDITLGFHGNPNKRVSVTYRSDPPLPSADIINLLAFGQTRQETEMQREGSRTSTLDETSNAVLGQAFNTVVSSRVEKLFGLSKVKIDPTANPNNNPTAGLITIEEQISNQVTVTYSTNLNYSSQQVFSVEYNLNDKISFLAVRDANGVFSLDMRIRQRKR